MEGMPKVKCSHRPQNTVWQNGLAGKAAEWFRVAEIAGSNEFTAQSRRHNAVGAGILRNVEQPFSACA